MNFRTSIAIGPLMAIFVVGCAHRGVVESLSTEGDATEAQINIGSPNVKEGDRLDVYKQVCGMRPRLGSMSVPSCRNVKVGEAQVTKVLDQDHSLAKADGDLKLEKSMRVERK